MLSDLDSAFNNLKDREDAKNLIYTSLNIEGTVDDIYKRLFYTGESPKDREKKFLGVFDKEQDIETAIMFIISGLVLDSKIYQSGWRQIPFGLQAIYSAVI